MIRFVDGNPTIVPDDERITPEMREAAISINKMLQWAQSDAPEVKRLREQYRTGRMLNSGFDWYCDGEPPTRES